jgi:hypothetical protein
MPSDSEIWQMLKENPDPRKLPSVETRTKETVLYGKEVINLNDLREQTKINLLGDASINGESLNNIKASKEWKRSGEHGRATEVGDIAVERIKASVSHITSSASRNFYFLQNILVLFENGNLKFIFVEVCSTEKSSCSSSNNGDFLFVLHNFFHAKAQN